MLSRHINWWLDSRYSGKSSLGFKNLPQIVLKLAKPCPLQTLLGAQHLCGLLMLESCPPTPPPLFSLDSKDPCNPESSREHFLSLIGSPRLSLAYLELTI